jgi:hypothetical protein
MSASRQLIETESSRRAFQAIQRQGILPWLLRTFPDETDTKEIRDRLFEVYPALGLSGDFRVYIWLGETGAVDTLSLICRLFWNQGSELCKERIGRMKPTGMENELTTMLDNVIESIEKAAASPVGPSSAARLQLVHRIEVRFDQARADYNQLLIRTIKRGVGQL